MDSLLHIYHTQFHLSEIILYYVYSTDTVQISFNLALRLNKNAEFVLFTCDSGHTEIDNPVSAPCSLIYPSKLCYLTAGTAERGCILL